MDQPLNKSLEKVERPMRSRYGLGLRSISLAIVVAFLVQDLASAQGGTPIWQNVSQAKSRVSSTLDEGALNKIAIPYESGLARKVVVKGTDEIIINIQDAHSKLGAQQSITNILDTLVKNYDLNLIALEGATDRVDTSLVASFPIEEARKKAGEYLLKEGKISAGEFYSMVSNEPVKLYGVDDPELYRENLDAFKALVETKLAVRGQLQGLKRAIKELEAKVYSPELEQMSSRRLLQKNGDIKFTEYWAHFKMLADSKGVDTRGYENLKKLTDTVALESEIDFKAAAIERDRLITELGTKLAKGELEKLVLQALQFKQNKITPGSFHYALAQLAESAKIDPARYPNIIRYAEYVVLYENIDLIAIFDEVERFENEIRERLFTNADERSLAELSHCVKILSQLLDTALTSQDYEFFVKNEASCEIAAIRGAFQALAEKYRVPFETYADFAVLEASIPNAKKFYELAERRNKALMQNTVRRMRSENVRVAALITGGFHTEGISKLMDQERLSYLVVMPKFDDKSPDRPYVAILTQKPKEYEEAFKGSDFYLAAASLYNASRLWPADMLEAEMKRTVASLLAGMRLSLGSNVLNEDVKRTFVDTYRARYQGGPLAPDTLERWLTGDVTIAKVSAGYRVTFAGEVFEVRQTADKGIASVIASGRADEKDAAVLRASVAGDDDAARKLRRKAQAPAIKAGVGARLASQDDLYEKRVSEAASLQDLEDILREANESGKSTDPLRSAAQERRLVLIRKAVESAGSAESAAAVLKEYPYGKFTADPKVVAMMSLHRLIDSPEASADQIRDAVANAVMDGFIQPKGALAARGRAAEDNRRAAAEAALSKKAAYDKKVEELIALIGQAAQTAGSTAVLGDLTQEIDMLVVTDPAVQGAIAIARTAIKERAEKKAEVEKAERARLAAEAERQAAAKAAEAVVTPAPAPIPTVAPAEPVVSQEAPRPAAYTDKDYRADIAAATTAEEVNAIRDKARTAGLTGRWVNDEARKRKLALQRARKQAAKQAAAPAIAKTPDAPAEAPKAAVLEPAVAPEKPADDRSAELSALWRDIRDAKDLTKLALFRQRAIESGLHTGGIQKYIDQRAYELKDIDLRARVRASLSQMGRSQAEIDAILARTDWSLVAGALDRENAKTYRDKHYGPSVEKFHFGDVWKKAKDELLKEGKIDAKKWGAMAGFIVFGRFALHLFRGFYLRHPGSAIRYHWLGAGRTNYLSTDETVKITLDNIGRQEAARTQTFPGLRNFIARAALVVRKAAEVTLVAAHFRFLTERASLYVVSTVIVGALVKFAVLNPWVLIPVLLLYTYAAVRYAPDRGTDEAAWRAHWMRMSILPALSVVIAAASLLGAGAVMDMNVLGAITPTGWGELPILKTLIASGSLPMMISPLATVFIRSFWRQSISTRRQMVGAQSFGLPGIDRGVFRKSDGTEARWALDGMSASLYLEAMLADPETDAARARQISEVFTAAIQHDAGRFIAYQRVLKANSVERARIQALLAALEKKYSPVVDAAQIAAYRNAMRQMVRRAGFEARRRVYGTGDFWKRLGSGWFSMWFVNTEISLVLSQMHVFDAGLSKAASAVSGSEQELHIFTPIAQVIEGANEDHPVARTGFSLLPSFLEDFAESGGLLGSFNTLVNGSRELVDKDFAAEQAAIREAQKLARQIQEAEEAAKRQAEETARREAERARTSDWPLPTPEPQAPGPQSLPKEEPAKPEEPKAPEVPAFPAPEPMSERVPVAGDVDVDAVLAKFDFTAPREEVIKAVEQYAVENLTRAAKMPIVVLAIDTFKENVRQNPEIGAQAFAVYVARVVRDANEIAARPGITREAFNRQMSELYGVAFPETPAAPAAPAAVQTPDEAAIGAWLDKVGAAKTKTVKVVKPGDILCEGGECGVPQPAPPAGMPGVVPWAPADAEIKLTTAERVRAHAEAMEKDPSKRAALLEMLGAPMRTPDGRALTYQERVNAWVKDNGLAAAFIVFGVPETGPGALALNADQRLGILLNEGSTAADIVPSPETSSIIVRDTAQTAVVGEIRISGTDEAVAKHIDERGRAERYEALDRTLWAEREDAPVSVLHSIGAKDTFAVMKDFRSIRERTQFLQSRGVSTRLFVPPADGRDADITLMKTAWTELTDPAQIKQAMADGRKFYALVSWTENGQVFEGVLESGLKAARQQFRESFSWMRSIMTERDLNILLTLDDAAAQRAAFGQRFGFDPGGSGVPFAAAAVTQDEFGNTGNITALYASSTLRYTLDAHNREQLVLDTPTGVRYLVYWPYGKEGTHNMFVAETAQEHERRYRADGSFETDPRFNLSPGREGDSFIIVGGNYLKYKEAEAAIGLYAEQRSTIAAGQYARYLDVKSKVGLLSIPLNLLTSGIGGPVANLATDLIMRPDQIGRPPSHAEISDYLTRYYHARTLEQRAGRTFTNADARQAEAAWAGLTAEQRAKLANEARTFLTGGMTAREEERLLGYLIQNYRDARASFLLNSAAGAGNIAARFMQPWTVKSGVSSAGSVDGSVGYTGLREFSKQSTVGKVFNDVFNNPYVSLNGDVNLMNIVANVSGSSALQSISQYFGVSINIFDLIKNQRTTIGYRSDASGEGFYPITKGTNLKISILGFDPHVFVDEANANKVLNVRRQGQSLSPEAPRMYIFDESFMGGKITQYSKEDFRQLIRVPISMASVNGQKVPVWLIVDQLEGDQKRYYFGILTEAGAADILEEAKRDTDAYLGWLQVRQNGGFIRNVSVDGGTLGQNTPTHLDESHDYEAAHYRPVGYTWDQALRVYRDVLAGQADKAAGKLGFFANYMEVNTRHGGQFKGFPSSFNVYTGRTIEGVTPAPTAAVGLAAMMYAAKTGDHRYDAMLAPIARWLEAEVSRGGGAARQNGRTGEIYGEPNAVIYAFLNNYAAYVREGRDQAMAALRDRRARVEAVELAQRVHAAAETLGRYFTDVFWDANAGLVRNQAGSTTYSADAQSRWMLAMGLDAFLGSMRADGLWAYLENVENTFTFTADYVKPNGETVRGLRIFDLATERFAAAQRRPNADGSARRIGFPEVTAEMMLVYQKAAESFAAAGHADHAARARQKAAFYRGELARMSHGGELPQSTRPGSYSGFGYHTALGNASLASRLQSDLTAANINAFKAPWSQQPAAALDPAPATTLVDERTAVRAQSVTDPAEVQRLQELIDSFVEKAKLERRKAAGSLTPAESQRLAALQNSTNQVRYVNEADAHEAVFRRQGGIKIRLEYVPSNAQNLEALDTARRAAEEAERFAAVKQALNADAAPAGAPGPEGETGRAGVAGPAGGAVFNDVNGRPIRDKEGHAIRIGMNEVDAVLDRVARLPLPERTRILMKNFADFEITLDADGDGKEEAVRVTLFFPKNAVTSREWTDPDTGAVTVHTFRAGQLAQSVNERTITTYRYDPYKHEVESQTFLNRSGDRAKPERGELLATQRTVEIRTYEDDRGVITEDKLYRARVVKLSQDHVTGALTLETYGLFDKPVQTIDLRKGTVTLSRFDARTGAFVSSETFVLANPVAFDISKGADALRETLVRSGVAAAVRGEPIATEKAAGKDAEGRVISERTDVKTGAVTRIWRDGFGREAGSSANGLRFEPVFDTAFQYGRVPKFVRVFNEATGNLIETWETTRYDKGHRLVRVTNAVIPGRVEDREYDPRYDEPVSVATARFFTEIRMGADGRPVQARKYRNLGTLDEPKWGAEPEIIENKLADDPASNTTRWQVLQTGKPERNVTRDARGRDIRSERTVRVSSQATVNVFNDTYYEGLVPQSFYTDGRSDGVEGRWVEGEGVSLAALEAFVPKETLAAAERTFGPLGAVRQNIRTHTLEGVTVKAEESWVAYDEAGEEIIKVNLTTRTVEIALNRGQSLIHNLLKADNGEYIFEDAPEFLMESSGPLKIGGAVYAVKTKWHVSRDKDGNLVKGDVSRVFAIGDLATEKVRLSMKGGRTGEAEHVVDNDHSDIYTVRYDAATGYAVVEPMVARVESGGMLTAEGGLYQLKVRKDLSGTVERVIAVDAEGNEKVRLTMRGDSGEAEVVVNDSLSHIYRAVIRGGRYEIVGEKIADVVQNNEITVGDKVYQVKARKDLDGQVRRVYAIDAWGQERLRFTLKKDGTGEAEHVLDEDHSEIFKARFINGRYLTEGGVVATVRTVGQTVIESKAYTVKQRNSAAVPAKVERLFAVDGVTGRVGEILSRPEPIEGVDVYGILIMDLDQTVNDLPAAAAIKAARGYAGNEAVKNIYYVDKTYTVVPSLGVNGLKGHTVVTDDKILGHEDWLVSDEIDTNGKLFIIRAFDDSGYEMATVTTLPDGPNEYLLEIKAKEAVTPADYEKSIYSQTYHSVKEGEVYTYDKASIITSALKTNFQVDLTDAGDDAGITNIIDTVLPIEAPDQQAIMDKTREKARTVLTESIAKIAANLGLDPTAVHLVQVEIEVTAGGRSYVLRVEDDPFARIIVFRSTLNEANVIVNTDWDGATATEADEFSKLGVRFRLVTDKTTPIRTVGDIFSVEGINAEMKDTILANAVSEDTNEQRRVMAFPISVVRRALVVADNEGREFETEASTRYVMKEDPLSRDFAVTQRGQLRVIKWFPKAEREAVDAKIPSGGFGISPGEIVVVGEVEGDQVQHILRDTEFARKEGEDFVYRLVYEYRNGVEYENPKAEISYNYMTGVVAEYYLDEEWKIHSKDGLPLYMTRMTGGKERLNSEFSTIVYRDPVTNDTYVLSDERLLTETPYSGPTSILMRNGKIVAIEEGEGVDRFFHTEPYDSSKTEKIHNSLILRIISMLSGESGHEQMIEVVRQKGRKLDLNHVPHEMPVFVDIIKAVQNRAWIGLLAGAAMLASFPMFVWLKRRFKVRAKSLNAPNVDISQLLYGKRALTPEETALVRKLITIRELSGPFTLGPQVPKDAREGLVRAYYVANGLSEAEAKTVTERFLSGGITFEDAELDPRDAPRAPPVSGSGIEASLVTAAGQGYPKAVIIQEMVSAGLVSGGEIAEFASRADAKGKKGAQIWESVVKQAVALAQTRVMSRIADGDAGALRSLPLSPEANLLRTLVSQGIVSVEQLQTAAKQGRSLYETVQDLTGRLVLDPVIDRTFKATYEGKVAETVLATLRQTVWAEFLPFLFKNPSLVHNFTVSGDVLYNPHPLNWTIEPVSLTEFVLLKFIQLNPSQTGGHSLGQLASMWPMSMYLVRRMHHAVRTNKTPEQVRKLASDLLGVMAPLMQAEINIMKAAITERLPWQKLDLQLIDLFIDTDLWDLFEFIGRRNQTLPEEAQLTFEGMLNDTDLASVGAKLKLLAKEIDAIAKDVLGKKNTLMNYDYHKADYADKVHTLQQEIEQGQAKLKAKQNEIDTLLSKGSSEDRRTIKQRLLEMQSDAGERTAVNADLATKRKWGRGLPGLYFNRIIRSLFDLKGFWGLGSTGRTVFIALSAVFIVAGVVMIPHYLALGVLMITTVPLLTLILFFGKASSVKERLFWAGAVAAGFGYVFGVLVHQLFWKAALIQFGLGFGFTAFLVLLTATLTVVSVHHLMGNLRSLFVLSSEVWSDTLRGLVGWRSMNPFRGFIGALLSDRVTHRELRDRFVGIWLPTTVLTFVASGLGLISLPWFTVLGLAVGGGIAIYQVLVLAKRLLQADRADFWEKAFGRLITEAGKVEKDHGALLSNGESVHEYLERLISLLHSRYLLSAKEKELWLKALRGQKDGRFVRPRSQKAFEVIYNSLFAIGQKKPAADVFAVLQATSSHVQAAGELFKHTVENSVLLGTFDADPKTGRRSSLLGYVARYHRIEWHNMLSTLVSAGSITTEISDRLMTVDEWTDILALLGALPLGPADRQAVLTAMLAFLDELRPNDSGVVESLAQDFIEYHLRAAHELGDEAYFDAVREIALDRRHRSLEEAFRALRQAGPSNAAERAFVDGYGRYKEIVSLKLRQLYQNQVLWGGVIKASSGGKNIEEIGALDNLIKELSNIAQVLPDSAGSIDRIKAGLAGLNPKTATDKTVFADVEKWSAAFLAWYSQNQDALAALIGDMQKAEDTEKDAEKLKRIKGAYAGINAAIDTLTQMAVVVERTERSDVRYSFHERASDNIIAANKQSGIANDLWAYYGRSVNFDAHVRNYAGQNVWRAHWASMQSQQRAPHRTVINPMMKIWATSSDAFPATASYAVSQEDWTAEVQRGKRRGLTFYGKATVTGQVISLYTPPGEDSAGFLILQARQPLYESTQIDWFAFEWGRPSLLAESLATTETRYAFNVTRFIMDRSQYAAMSNPELPADKKLTHLGLWAHYFSVIMALSLIVLLPALSPFSSFAFLKPFAFYVVVSFLLMDAVNGPNHTRLWRQTGNFWTGLALAVIQKFAVLPFYVSLLPFFLRGVWLGSNEAFSFLRTVKNAALQVWTRAQRFIELMSFRRFGPMGIPLNTLVGMGGVVSWLLAFFFMTPWGPAVLLPYLLASLAFLSGLESYGVFKDRKGHLKGYRYRPIQVIGNSAYAVFWTAKHLWLSFRFYRRKHKLEDSAKKAELAKAAQPESKTPPSGARLAEQPRTLVFGGTGFVGSEVTRQLVREGKPVKGVGRNHNFDINRDVKELNASVAGAEQVVFLAGRGATNYEDLEGYMAGVLQLMLVIKAMQKHAPDAPIVLGSSSFAYMMTKPSAAHKETESIVWGGMPAEDSPAKLQRTLWELAREISEGRFRAEDSRAIKRELNRRMNEIGLGPQWRTNYSQNANAYALSKVLSEEAVKESGLNYIILRMGNIYGEGQQPERAIRNFTTALLHLYLFGDVDRGRATVFLPDLPRQYIYAGDVARFIAILLADPGRYAGRTINLASELEYETARGLWYRIFKDAVLKRSASAGEQDRLLAQFEKPQVPRVKLIMDTLEMEKIIRQAGMRLTPLGDGIDRVAAHETGVIVAEMSQEEFNASLEKFEAIYRRHSETDKLHVKALLAKALDAAKQSGSIPAKARLEAMLAKTGARLALDRVSVGVRDFDTYDALVTDARFKGVKFELLPGVSDGARLAAKAGKGESVFIVGSIEPAVLLQAIEERQKTQTIDRDVILTYAADILEGKTARLELPAPSPVLMIRTSEGALWLQSAGQILTAEELQQSLLATTGPDADMEAFVRNFAVMASKDGAAAAQAVRTVDSAFIKGLLETGVDTESEYIVGLHAMTPDAKADLAKQLKALTDKGARIELTDVASMAELKQRAEGTAKRPILLTSVADIERTASDPLVMAMNEKAESVEGALAVAYKVAMLNGELSIRIPGLVNRGTIWIYLPIRQVLAEILRQAITTKEATGVSA